MSSVMRGLVTAEAAERQFEPLGRCRDVEEFEKLNRIGEGTYGTVYRARDRKTRQIVALKRVLLHNEASEGVRAAMFSDRVYDSNGRWRGPADG